MLAVNTIDMAALMTAGYELGDLINESREVATFLYWHEQVKRSKTVLPVVEKQKRAAELFEEVQRFGHFHPNYHEAKDRMREIESELAAIPEVQQYRAAERAVDELLYEVAKLIAGTVSESIKVPAHEGVASGCGSGGSCGCGSGGCG